MLGYIDNLRLPVDISNKTSKVPIPSVKFVVHEFDPRMRDNYCLMSFSMASMESAVQQSMSEVRQMSTDDTHISDVQLGGRGPWPKRSA